MRTFTLICETERESMRSAIDLTEQLVEHGYVDTARVQDDADGTYVPEEVAELTLKLTSAAEALTALANEASRAVTEPRRFHENENHRQQTLGQVIANARLVVSEVDR